MTTLLLRLKGALQSYGTPSALWSVRDTATEPTKAAVLGMALGALGKDRETDGKDSFPTLSAFSALRMGVRVDAEGLILGDFQTVCSADGYLPKAGGGTKKGNLCFTKFFLNDASFLVGLEGDEALLKSISKAFLSPRWAPCLGRRGCVPNVPIRLPDGGLRPAPLEEALKNEGKIGKKTRFVVEVQPGKGTRRCQDVPLSFATTARAFGLREVKEWIENGGTDVH